MDFLNTTIYLSSIEQKSDELPVRCSCIGLPKQKIGNTIFDRGIVLVKSEKTIKMYNADTLLLVPKHDGYPVSRLEFDEVIFVYALQGDLYVNVDVVDLENKENKILDWCAVALSYEIAEKWQVKN